MTRQVTMYTLSTCPWCRKAKQFFTDAGVEFDYTDVDLLPPEEQTEVSERVFELSGTRQYPVVVIDGRVVCGYNPSRYKDLLDLES